MSVKSPAGALLLTEAEDVPSVERNADRSFPPCQLPAELPVCWPLLHVRVWVGRQSKAEFHQGKVSGGRISHKHIEVYQPS